MRREVCLGWCLSGRALMLCVPRKWGVARGGGRSGRLRHCWSVVKRGSAPTASLVSGPFFCNEAGRVPCGS